MQISRLVLAVALSVLTAVAPAAERSEQVNFVLGNFAFALLHELAHVVIGDKNVPILGSLESAADYTAVTMAIRGGDSENAKAFLTQALADTTAAFATSWSLAEANRAPVPYWDVHALGIQRYYAVLCLVYGSDPETHEGLRAKLPVGRAAGCPAEYRMADAGLQWLVETYGRQPGNDERVDIAFDYEPVASRNQQKFLAPIRELNLVERTVRAIDDAFGFEEPFEVSMRACKRPEAAWQPERRELILCYELLEAFAQIYRLRSRVER